MTTPARCPMCSETVAEDDLQRHLRSHGFRLLWWLWKDNRSGAAMVAVMAAIAALTFIAAWMAAFEFLGVLP